MLLIRLLHSHEVMNLGEALRYVTEEDYESFGGREKRRQAWSVRTGWLGKMIFKDFNITHIQNGHTIFTHGDMEPEWARHGSETMNHLAREAIWHSNYQAPIFRGTGKHQQHIALHLRWQLAFETQENTNMTCTNHQSLQVP